MLYYSQQEFLKVELACKLWFTFKVREGKFLSIKFLLTLVLESDL